jgi:catechol 2,3-dioxygenase-like lactoylglutathione lyase family enzyme
MINHMSLGVTSVANSKKFYDAALGALGYQCLSHGDASLGYGDTSAVFWVYQSKGIKPGDARPGLHVCFDAKSTAAVDKFHAAGLKNGGQDNGAPGIRKDYSPTYYAAFLVDPDGYRLEAYCEKR